MANRWGNNGNSDRLNFLGLQNHCWQWLKPWNYHCVGASVCSRYVCPVAFVKKLGLKWVWVTSSASVIWQLSPQWEIRLEMEWVEPKSVMSLGFWYAQWLTSFFVVSWDSKVLEQKSPCGSCQSWFHFSSACVLLAPTISFNAILRSSCGATGARACDQCGPGCVLDGPSIALSSRMLPNLPP